jgi:hypothetical protein
MGKERVWCQGGAAPSKREAAPPPQQHVCQPDALSTALDQAPLLSLSASVSSLFCVSMLYRAPSYAAVRATGGGQLTSKREQLQQATKAEQQPRA